MKQWLSLLLVVVILVACKKETVARTEETDPITAEIKAQTAEFTALIQKHD